MSNEVIKKIRLKKSELPHPVGDNTQLSYNIRYRVVSEDRNRYSHWSPIFSLNINNTTNEVGWDPNDPINTSIPNTITITKPSHQAELTWTMPALLITNPTTAEKILQQQQAAIPGFDVYVQWKEGTVESDWIWLRETSASRFGMTYPAKVGSVGPDYIKFAVQKITQVKERFNAATYLVTDWNSL